MKKVIVERTVTDECDTVNIEQWENMLPDLMGTLCTSCRRDLAYRLAFDAALFGGENGYEMIGILEAVKQDLIKTLNDEENEEKNINNNR